MPVGRLAGMSSRPSTRPRVAISSPGDVASVLPYYVGFHPTDSIVVAGLLGARREIGPVLRYDADAPVELAAPDVVAKLARHGITALYVVIYSNEIDSSALADCFRSHARAGGLEVIDVVTVWNGRWRSCLCRDPSCCPAEGSPLPDPTSGVGGQVAAMAALEGRTVLPTRADIAATVAAPVALAARAGALRIEQAADRAENLIAGSGADGFHRQVVKLVESGARAFADGNSQIDPDDAALVVVAVEASFLVRDDVASLPTVPLTGLVDYLCAIARLTPDPFAAATCSLVACNALRQGSGALANVAIERALDNDPSYSFAQILAEMTAAMLSPADVQAWAASARAHLPL